MNASPSLHGLKVVVGLDVPQVMTPLGAEVIRLRLRPAQPAKVFLLRANELSSWLLEDKGSYCVPTLCTGRNILASAAEKEET